MKLLAVIPSRSNKDGLLNVVNHCLNAENVQRVLVYDNGYAEKFDLPEGAAFVDAVGWSFYRMWNDGWRMAAEGGYDAVAVLNDDIGLAPGSLNEATSLLLEDPFNGIVGLNYERRVKLGVDSNIGWRPASGSYRDHGIGGHAFILSAATWGVVPPIDEQYHLWYGDDELFANVARCGFKLKIALGAPVDHEESTTANKHPELLARTSEDRKLFESKFS